MEKRRKAREGEAEQRGGRDDGISAGLERKEGRDIHKGGERGQK